MTANPSYRCVWLWLSIIGTMINQDICEAFSAKLISIRNAGGRAHHLNDRRDDFSAGIVFRPVSFGTSGASPATTSTSEMRMFPSSLLESHLAEELRTVAATTTKELSSSLSSPPPPLVSPPPPSGLMNYLNAGAAVDVTQPPPPSASTIMEKVNSIVSSSSPPTLPSGIVLDFSKSPDMPSPPPAIADAMEKLNSMAPSILRLDATIEKVLLQLQESMDSLPWYAKALGAVILTATTVSLVIDHIIIPTIAATLEKKAQQLAPERWMAYYEEKLQEEGDKSSALTKSRLAMRPELMEELQNELKPLIEADLAESALGVAGKVLGYHNT